MKQLLKTVFYDKHVNLGAKMVEFGGWDMPVQYESGIVQEHLSTRRQAGLWTMLTSTGLLRMNTCWSSTPPTVKRIGITC